MLRAELVTMNRDLPASLKFPKVRGTGEGNSEGLTLVNDSKILFKSAGVKKSKSSGTLGRSVGLSLATLSELCSFDNDEGLEAFENSLSDVNPDRLTSTNRRRAAESLEIDVGGSAPRRFALQVHFPRLVVEGIAVNSSRSSRFQGLWRVSADREGARQDQGGQGTLWHEITLEQLAWIRRKMDPTAQAEGDANPEFEGDPFRIQEQPWTNSRHSR
jgi:hypothetical protein